MPSGRGTELIPFYAATRVPMDDKSPSRLDKITTSWTLLAEAQSGVSAARALLLKRYGGTARRYLAAVLRNTEAVDDLAQEFALALVAGKLDSAATAPAAPGLRQGRSPSPRQPLSQTRGPTAARPGRGCAGPT